MIVFENANELVSPTRNGNNFIAYWIYYIAPSANVAIWKWFYNVFEHCKHLAAWAISRERESEREKAHYTDIKLNNNKFICNSVHRKCPTLNIANIVSTVSFRGRTRPQHISLITGAKIRYTIRCEKWECTWEISKSTWPFIFEPI